MEGGVSARTSSGTDMLLVQVLASSLDRVPRTSRPVPRAPRTHHTARVRVPAHKEDKEDKEDKKQGPTGIRSDLALGLRIGVECARQRHDILHDALGVLTPRHGLLSQHGRALKSRLASAFALVKPLPKQDGLTKISHRLQQGKGSKRWQR